MLSSMIMDISGMPFEMTEFIPPTQNVEATQRLPVLNFAYFYSLISDFAENVPLHCWYIGCATIFAALVVGWCYRQLMSTLKCKPIVVQWLCINQPLRKFKSLIWVSLIWVLNVRPATGAYFDVAGVTSGFGRRVNGVCITRSGEVSQPSLDSPSIAQNLGAMPWSDLDAAAIGLDQGTCLTGIFPIEFATLLVPYCKGSGGIPVMFCNPGTSTIMRCPIGEILWVGTAIEGSSSGWTSVTPITDGWYVGQPGRYPVSQTDLRGYLALPNFIVWGTIDPETAANSTVPACECDATQCDVDALIGFKCENAYQKSCTPTDASLNSQAPVIGPASSQGPGGLVSAGYYKVAFSMLAIMLYQM